MDALEKLGYEKTTKFEGVIMYEKKISSNMKKGIFMNKNDWEICYRSIKPVSSYSPIFSIDFEEIAAMAEIQKEMERAEEKGYIKDEVADLKKIVVDPSKIGPTITVKDTTDKQLNPDHYKVGKLQAIEQMMIVFGPSKVANFCEVNAFKYHARAGLKGDAVMDHKKADWYMRLYERLSKYSSGQTDKALEVLREFLKEEEEK